jgi:hypothetical protein
VKVVLVISYSYSDGYGATVIMLFSNNVARDGTCLLSPATTERHYSVSVMIVVSDTVKVI